MPRPIRNTARISENVYVDAPNNRLSTRVQLTCAAKAQKPDKAIATYTSARSPEALLISKRRFERFTPQEQALVRTAAARSVPHMRMLWDKAEAESRAAVVSAGVQVTEVDRKAFRQAAQPLLAEYLRNPQLQRLYKDIRAAA